MPYGLLNASVLKLQLHRVNQTEYCNVSAVYSAEREAQQGPRLALALRGLAFKCPKPAEGLLSGCQVCMNEDGVLQAQDIGLSPCNTLDHCTVTCLHASSTEPAQLYTKPNAWSGWIYDCCAKFPSVILLHA